MPVSFTCPHCGKQTEVADQYIGRTGPCAACGKMITVPGPGAEGVFIPPQKRNYTWLVVLLIVAGVVVLALPCLAFLAMPNLGRVHETSRRLVCANNLRTIGLAMMMHETSRNVFPPAYTTGKQGRPLLSWRVLLLPYLDQQDLYYRFHLDEPWDSPHNLPLAREMPKCFRCPSRPEMQPGYTPYMVIVGPHTVFPGKDGIHLAEISDGPSKTILVVEAQGPGVSWTAPNDLDAATMSFAVNSESGACIGGHVGGGHVVMCDGRSEFLLSTADPEMVRRAVMRDDGLPIDEKLLFGKD
jgi:hypothetical protein